MSYEIIESNPSYIIRRTGTMKILGDTLVPLLLGGKRSENEETSSSE